MNVKLTPSGPLGYMRAPQYERIATSDIIVGGFYVFINKNKTNEFDTPLYIAEPFDPMTSALSHLRAALEQCHNKFAQLAESHRAKATVASARADRYARSSDSIAQHYEPEIRREAVAEQSKAEDYQRHADLTRAALEWKAPK